jgi:hypothetical protein
VIGEPFGGLAEEWPDCRAIREKIENEQKIRKWFQDLTTVNT